MRRMGSAERIRQRAKTRAKNRVRKTRERAARERRMVAAIQGGSLPYTPWVMSWLNDQLGKAPKAITQADVDGLVSRVRAQGAAV